MQLKIMSNASARTKERRDLRARRLRGTATALAATLAVCLGFGCSSTAADDGAELLSSPLGAAEAARAAQFATGELIWRNTATGENAFWTLLGTDIGASGYFTPVGGNAWKLAGSADFNGDGIGDLLWRNYVTGENAVWYLDAQDKIASSAYIAPLADATWQLAGAADMDRDGHPDLLWRNTSSGQNAIWYLNGTNVLRGEFIQSVPDANWKLRGGGDLDGDGTPELIWRNPATGEVAAWFMGAGGTALTRGVLLTPVADASWELETAGDIDGDGKADLVWKNLGSGQTAVWYMNGTAIDSSGYLTSVPDPSWRVVGTRRRENHGFQFDAKPGSAAYDGGIRSWLVNPGKGKGEMTTVFGSDGRRVRAVTQIKVSEINGGEADYKLRTQRSLLQELGVREVKTARGTPWIETIPAHAEFWSALVRDMPTTAPNPRGSKIGGPDETMSTCYDTSFTTGLAAFGTIAAGLSCLSAAGTTVGCGASAFFTVGATTPVCAAIAGITVGACAGAVGALCGLNGALVAQECCHGRSANNWPWPNSCFPNSTTAQCTCSDKAQFAGWHAEYSKGVLDDSVVCKPGQYKQLLKVRSRDAGTPGTGGYPCGPPRAGNGAFSYSEKIGYQEINYDWWDSAPAIVVGARTYQGSYDAAKCTEYTNSVTSPSVSGQRKGQALSFSEVGWRKTERESYNTVYNGERTSRTDKEVSCEGWDSGPESDYAKCVAGVKSGNGGSLDSHPVGDTSCTADPCGAVGWNDR